MANHIHILYIDDNPLDRALVRDSLEKEHGGFILTEAKSQHEFEELIHKNVYDLVLSDFNILGFEGLQVLEIVKKVSPNTPVILVTGTGSEEVAVEAMKRGASDYVIKTASHINRLPKTIHTVIASKQIRLEKEKAQKELVKINRVYAVISQINQLIVRTNDREKLFREACDIAINFGGFRMAWIGLVDYESESIKPFCWAGHEANYLANFEIPIAGNSLTGKEPVGKAYKEKQHSVFNDVLNDPLFEPWRNEALKRDYRSIISLPIKAKKEIIGIFSICSTETNFFDKQEIDLLVEVAEDISFALESIQKDQELIFTKERYKSLYDNAPLPYQSLNSEGIIMDVNPAWLRLLGYTLDEVIGKWYGSFLHPNAKAIFVKNFPLLKTCGSVTDVPFMLQKKDGSYIHISLNGMSSYHPDGSFKQTHCVFQDITIQNAALEKLKNSENQKSVILHTTSEGFWIVDQKGRFIEVNNSYCKLSGYSRNELLTMSVSDVELIDTKENIEKRLQRIIKQGTDRFETKHRCKNGNSLDFEVSINYMPDNKLFFVFLHDITKRKANEKLLLRSERELKKAQEITRIGSWHMDLTTNEVVWTEELYKMYGFDPKLPAPTYTEHQRIFTPESWELLSASVAKIIETGIPYERELRSVRNDGSNGWIWVKGEAITDSNGKIIGLWGAAQDITDRKQGEEELRRAKEKAEESDRLKTAFLHNVSHEIRTPLNAIVGFSELLNTPELPSENIKQFTETILQSSNQLLSIITDIVNVATIEAGQTRIVEKETNLNSILRLLNEQFTLKAEKQNISLSLKTTLPDNEALVKTDETKLIEILSNLLSNSLKFTEQGFIRFGYHLKGSNLNFYVEDTGIGIPSDMHDRIFQRFGQVETTTSRLYGGSGLGLSISKAYVELLGGKIWVSSELSKGSIFHFTIPYNKISPSVLSEIPSIDSINKTSKSI